MCANRSTSHGPARWLGLSVKSAIKSALADNPRHPRLVACGSVGPKERGLPCLTRGRHGLLLFAAALLDRRLCCPCSVPVLCMQCRGELAPDDIRVTLPQQRVGRDRVRQGFRQIGHLNVRLLSGRSGEDLQHGAIGSHLGHDAPRPVTGDFAELDIALVGESHRARDAVPLPPAKVAGGLVFHPADEARRLALDQEFTGPLAKRRADAHHAAQVDGRERLDDVHLGRAVRQVDLRLRTKYLHADLHVVAAKCRDGNGANGLSEGAAVGLTLKGRGGDRRVVRHLLDHRAPGRDGRAAGLAA
mmetsp:Transcript_36433/g.117002  ORF Transcript_36433/g.117002 Transcript_36433/m.117002 type:complete len:302 (-) Transcript_36433:436-1341(-)